MTNKLEAILTRIFRAPEEINGGGRCPTYLYRWHLLRVGSKASRLDFTLYLHKFVGEDWSRDLHDHPKRFISIGLKGSYVEHTTWPTGWGPFLSGVGDHRQVTYRAPWIRTFPATHVHRLTGPTPERPCWTLVLVLNTVREWGFWRQGGWVKWREYLKRYADGGKACR